MPYHRRFYLPGGSFFFTVVTDRRRRFLTDAHARELLRKAIQSCRAERPFRILAMVLLPDHLHAIWTLPPGDSDYSARWGIIKATFTKAWLSAGGSATKPSAARLKERWQGVWQPRFWEHTLRDETDLERHLDYIHYNPVKHGLVRCPYEWPWSSFHRWVRFGQYEPNWACGLHEAERFKFDDIANSVGE